jgi:hypothetical protein
VYAAAASLLRHLTDTHTHTYMHAQLLMHQMAQQRGGNVIAQVY